MLPFALVIVLGIANFVHKRYKGTIIQRYFLPALYLRFLGAIAVACIYEYYYKSGDTWGYFIVARIVRDMFYSGDFVAMFDFLLGPDASGFSSTIMAYLQDVDDFSAIYTRVYPYGNGTRITSFLFGIINIFTFNSYLATGIVGGMISFIGCWLLFLAFYDRYPMLHLSLAAFTLFVPSLFFWGTMVGKEPFVVLGLGLFTYGLLVKAKSLPTLFLHGIYLAVGAYLMYIIKPYILFASLPAVVAYIGTKVELPIASPWNKLVKLIFIVSILPASVLLIGFFGSVNDKYSLEKATSTVEAFQQEQIAVSGGSSYNIGSLDMSPTGLPIYMVKAVNVTLFRPYFWEVRNANQLIAFVESFLIVLITLYVLYQIGLFTFLAGIVQSPIVLYAFIFTCLLGFIVGATAFNFGTLVRYKIPCLPFYLCGLSILYYKAMGKDLLEQFRLYH